MSWTDVFPVLTDEHVDEFEAKATKKERKLYEDWFAVRQVFNARDVPHIVSTSLFWKNIRMEMPQIVVKDRAMLMNAGRKGRKLLRFEPWKHYVEPLLKGAFWLKKNRPNAAMRVYLAGDMEFLLPDLVAAGCEVHLMKSNSLAHNPGAMWRLLAFEESDKLVTLIDADRAEVLESEMARTEEARRMGLGWWRVPVWGELNEKGTMNYRPILGGQIGTNMSLPTKLLMQALIWHTEHQSIETMSKPPGCKPVKIHGSEWPDYAFDEWFLQTAVYPRAAFDGLLTFVPAEAKSRLMPLDIEYTMWANPASRMVHFGSSGGGGCGPGTSQTPNAKPAVSRILPKLLKEVTAVRARFKSGNGQPRSVIPPQSTLVVARYKEDLSWLKKVDSRVRIVVYNKGPEITEKSVLKRINQLTQLSNRGRESDTYLAHLEHGRSKGDGAWTIFSQGDPFTHSPDFLKLLAARGKGWNPVQPLTSRWVLDRDVPPKLVCDLEHQESQNGLKVRSEVICLQNFVTLGNYDPNRFGVDYTAHHGLPPGWSVAGHFLEQCGLMELAERAWRSYVGQFAYGAIFAVRTERLDAIPKACLQKMRELACGFLVHGYLFERLWLHMFGLPFQITEKDKVRTLRSTGAAR